MKPVTAPRLLFAALAVSGALAAHASFAPTATLVESIGKTTLFPIGYDPEDALSGSPVGIGERVETGAAGRAQLRLGSRAIGAQLGPYSTLRLEGLDDEGLQAEAALLRGLAWFEVRSEAGATLRLRAGAAELQSTGAEIVVNVNPAVDETGIFVRHGRLRVASGGAVAWISGGYRVTLTKQGLGPVTALHAEVWDSALRGVAVITREAAPKPAARVTPVPEVPLAPRAKPRLETPVEAEAEVEIESAASDVEVSALERALLEGDLHFRDWSMRCETLAAAGIQSCYLYQNLPVEVIGQNLVHVVIAFVGTGDPTLIVTLPFGIHVPSGLRIGVAGGGQWTAAIDYCDGLGCHAGFALQSKVRTAFQNGATAQLKFRGAEQRSHSLDVSLLGFTKAYAALQAAHLEAQENASKGAVPAAG